MRKRRPTVITKSDDVEVGAAGSQRAPFRGIDLSRRDEETLKSLKQEWKSLSYHMLGTGPLDTIFLKVFTLLRSLQHHQVHRVERPYQS